MKRKEKKGKEYVEIEMKLCFGDLAAELDLARALASQTRPVKS
jgi:hypothetical protein